MLNKVFSSICFSGELHLTLDTPRGGRGRNVMDFLKVGNSVMSRSGSSVVIGVAKSGRVQVAIYDVMGRKVRDLADRIFPAGEHTLQWDGTDDAGSKLARGVYFVRS